MNPKLQKIQKMLRDLRLLKLVDKCRLSLRRIRMFKKNKLFIKNNPDFVLPPVDLAFDAHGLDWNFYAASGKSLSDRIGTEIVKYHNGPVNCLLEWGCGPGRVIRYFPSIFPNAKIIGTDYNAATIDWCKDSLKGITFLRNDLSPPLDIESGSVDAIYAISVFTHLSEQICLKWVNELHRVLNDNGILMVWTNGDYIANFLLPEEQDKYNKSNFVIRDKFEEGKKMFLSFHPPLWVRNTLLSKFEVVKHYSGGFSSKEQDVWICRKKGV